MFADVDAGDVRADRPEGAADVRRGDGFQVPGVELAGAADEEEQDTVDVAGRGLRLGPEEVGQRQAHGPGAEGAGAEEIATIHEPYLREEDRPGDVPPLLAAPVIIGTGQPVMAVGGFFGYDPVMSVEAFAKKAEQGEVRYVVLAANRRLRDFESWVRTNGKPVDPGLWRSRPPEARRAIVLYDLAAAP